MNKENNGFIFLHRKILDNPWLDLDNDAYVLWTKILLYCTHSGRDVIFEGKRIKLNPGQLLTGRKWLANQANISESKVQRILKKLEIEQQIEQQTTPNNRLITVKNWYKYQKPEQRIEQQVNNKRTTSEQQMNTYNKEIKKEGNNILQPTVAEEPVYVEEYPEKNPTLSKQVFALMAKFHEYNPGIKISHKTHRKACEELINIRGYDLAKQTVDYALSVQGQQFAPTITTPTQLINKLGDLRAYGERQKSKAPTIVKI